MCAKVTLLEHLFEPMIPGLKDAMAAIFIVAIRVCLNSNQESVSKEPVIQTPRRQRNQAANHSPLHT